MCLRHYAEMTCPDLLVPKGSFPRIRMLTSLRLFKPFRRAKKMIPCLTADGDADPVYEDDGIQHSDPDPAFGSVVVSAAICRILLQDGLAR